MNTHNVAITHGCTNLQSFVNIRCRLETFQGLATNFGNNPRIMMDLIGILMKSYLMIHRNISEAKKLRLKIYITTKYQHQNRKLESESTVRVSQKRKRSSGDTRISFPFCRLNCNVEKPAKNTGRWRKA